jgi:hypothetical protein
MRLIALTALLSLAAATALVSFTSASFTSDTQSAAATFRTGTLTVHFDGDGELGAASLRPGGTRERTFTASNTGTLPAHLSLDLGDPAPTSSTASALRLAVLSCTADGTCDPVMAPQALTDVGSVDLGTVAAGAERRFKLALSLPAGTPAGDLQGTALDLHLRWSAQS